MDILHKPNPLIEGVLAMDKSVDLMVFNKVLCNLQKTSKQDIHVAIITYEEMKKIIVDTSISNPKAMLDYIKNTFMKKIISFRLNNNLIATPLITKAKYNYSNREFEIFVDDDLTQMILNYRTMKDGNKKIGVSPLNLQLLSNSRNFYAQRLYEILRQWSSIGVKRIKLEDLKEKLMVADNYPVYYEFKRRVLNNAIDKINKNFNMTVTFEEIKKGKKIDEIIFYIDDKEPRQYNYNLGINQQEKIIEPKKTSSKKLAKSTINTIIKKYGENEVNEAMKIMEENSKLKPISAPKKYITAILENRKMELNKKTVSNFANFTQRQYDYEKLEKQLLGWDDEEDED